MHRLRLEAQWAIETPDMVLVLCSCSVVSCPLVSPWRLFIIAKGLFIVAREQSTDNSVCLLDDAVGLMVQRLPAALGACLPSRSQAAWRLPRPRYARLKPPSTVPQPAPFTTTLQKQRRRSRLALRHTRFACMWWSVRQNPRDEVSKLDLDSRG